VKFDFCSIQILLLTYLLTVFVELPWSSVSMAKTTMDCHSELVLHSLRNNQPVQVVMHHSASAFLEFGRATHIKFGEKIAQLLSFPMYLLDFRHIASVRNQRALKSTRSKM